MDSICLLNKICKNKIVINIVALLLLSVLVVSCEHQLGITLNYGRWSCCRYYSVVDISCLYFLLNCTIVPAMDTFSNLAHNSSFSN